MGGNFIIITVQLVRLPLFWNRRKKALSEKQGYPVDWLTELRTLRDILSESAPTAL